MFAWKSTPSIQNAWKKESYQQVENDCIDNDAWPALVKDSKLKSPSSSSSIWTNSQRQHAKYAKNNQQPMETYQSKIATNGLPTPPPPPQNLRSKSTIVVSKNDFPVNTETLCPPPAMTTTSSEPWTNQMEKTAVPQPTKIRRSLSASAVESANVTWTKEQLPRHRVETSQKNPNYSLRRMLDQHANAELGDPVYTRCTRSMSLPSCSYVPPPVSLKSNLSSQDVVLEEDKNFDSDDSCSSSTDTTTICSYNSSPRSSSPKSPLHQSSNHFAGVPELTLDEIDELATCLSPKGMHSASIASHGCVSFISDMDIDEERLAALAEEFRITREREEANALAWSVRQAARMGVISESMEESLYDIIGNGSFDEARDVIYHKCHLIPAVRNLNVQSDSNSERTTILTDQLNKYINVISPMDTPTARAHKNRVLQCLSNLVVTWVKGVAVERGLSPEHIALTSGALFVAGSHRMGLNDPLSDIDTVAVAPWHVTQEDFFGSFVELLRECPEVRSLTPVTSAFVPLIALVYDNVAIDILFARLPTPCVLPSQDIDSDHILMNVDPASMKSLNAPRVSTLILCLVPKRRVFLSVLRAVRCWARARGIYSSKLGYLGGVSWAILVAFVCQMFPADDPSTVFTRFFQVISDWQWPQAIILNVLFDAELGFENWDPRSNVYDRTHIMPIITPAYPPMNSAVQVSHATFSVMHEELWRGRYYAEKAMACDPTAQIDESVWAPLFTPSNFFVRYDTYLALTFSAKTSEDMCVWSKFVQSRVRKLVDSLQHVNPIARVHAIPRYFPHSTLKNPDNNAIHQCVFIGIEFQNFHGAVPPRKIALDDDPQISISIEQTIKFFEATDMQQFGSRSDGMQASVSLMKWESLPSFVFDHGKEHAIEERRKFREEKPLYPSPPNSPFACQPSNYFGNSRNKTRAKKSRRKQHSPK